MSGTMNRSLISAVTLIVAVALLCLDAQAQKRVSRGKLGCRPPNAKEVEWQKKNVIIAERIRPNALACERMKAEGGRVNGIERAVVSEAVPFGGEIVGRTELEMEAGRPAAAAPESDTPVGAPVAVDNSKLKAFPPVRSQGSIGSCACFSTTYYIMTHMTAMARGIDASGSDNATKFSPKFVYNMINGGSDSGSWMWTAYSVMQTNGAPTWAEWPYDSNYREWPTSGATWRNAINYRMDQQGKITGVDTATGLDSLKALLANGYLVTYATDIYGWQFGTILDNPATPGPDPETGKKVCKYGNGAYGSSGHAMTIVGYDDNLWVDVNSNGAVDAGERGAIKIVNSWGTGWQDAGFCWVSYDALKTTSAVAGWNGGAGRVKLFWYSEVYWITARASYAPSVIAEFTANTASRNSIRAELGVSNTTSSYPSQYWSTNALYGSGGTYAFNGTTTACDGTFALDFSDIAPAPGQATRWYLKMQGAPSVTIKSYKVVDMLGGTEAAAGNLPYTFDVALKYFPVDFTRGGTPLPTPTGLAASDGAVKGKIVVTWNAAQGAGGYKVFRAASVDGAKSEASAWIAGTTFEDTTVAPATLQWYWVKAAKDLSGGSASAFSSSDSGYSLSDDAQAPAAELGPDAPVLTAQDLSFPVVYTDNLSINRATIDGQDIVVKGPNSFAGAAAVVSISTDGNAPSITVVYKVAAPGGAWTAANAGPYSFVIQAGQIRDTGMNAVPAQTIGALFINP